METKYLRLIMFRVLDSSFKNLKKFSCLLGGQKPFSNVSSNVTTASKSAVFDSYLINRNPRNLERLRIARKPTGYHLDKPNKTYWHKLVLERKARAVVAKVYHKNGNSVIEASTNEWCISKRLFRTNDAFAYVNLAQVLARRCLESGIYYVTNGIETNSPKNREFLKNVEQGGITLFEPSVYKPLTPWSFKIDEKPWKVFLS